MSRKLVDLRYRLIHFRPAAGILIITLLITGLCSYFAIEPEIRKSLANLFPINAEFGDIIDKGLSKYHYKYVEVEGIANYDMQYYDKTESHRIINRYYFLIHPEKNQIILVQTPFNPSGFEEGKIVTGIIHRMDRPMRNYIRENLSTFSMREWQLNPNFYIREGEQPPTADFTRKVLIYLVGGISIIALLIIPFLIPGNVEEIPNFDRL
jgi:hypothetical protein